MYRYQADTFLALPGAVSTFAWSAPMRELAARIGVSDVSLKKIFTRGGIVAPPQGHWNRVRAGRTAASCPRPRERGPVETGRVRLDGRFRGHVPEAGPIPEQGPFASREVPESLADLREQELAKIGQVTVPRDLAKPHAGLSRLLKKEGARREKAAASGWHWDEPRLDTPLARRQLRVLGGLFKALDRRGHHGEAWEDNYALKWTCTIGETMLSLDFSVAGKHRKQLIGGYERPAPELPTSTALRLSLSRKFREPVTAEWQDWPRLHLEQRLAEIAADLIGAGEASFRQGLAEARERDDEFKRWQEQRKRQKREELDRERLACLAKSGELLRQANDLRLLVERVGLAVSTGTLALTEGELAAWRTWASARADELDPALSGQVLSHIRVG